MEFLIAIALLCQLNNGDTYLNHVEDNQHKCHEYYAKCLTHVTTTEQMRDCILNRQKDKK